MTNRAKALEALGNYKSIPPKGVSTADTTFRVELTSEDIETIRLALQDAPRVEVIEGLEDALSRESGLDATLAFIILENSGIDCTDKSIGQVNTIVKAATAYAKLQGKGEL